MNNFRDNTSLDLNYGQINIKNLIVPWSIGVFSYEKNKPQRVRINLTLKTNWEVNNLQDKIEKVVSYSDIVEGIKSLSVNGHINLVETLAKNIADLCLDDARIYKVCISIEKLDVYENVESVGIQAEFSRKY
ncbi:MAG: dihydroneopterin aldolase [Alphaproteobacteria bacterium]|nr:dihydroneopterin aldolase [Alphaproteobacteria bacterium]|tara:strand:+ start:62 stop:457 length:396 start_codon:yes stop_codon:yes gene_type:complete